MDRDLTVEGHTITFTRKTNSMSSLKNAMKDRLAIVMRNICTNYDAYSLKNRQRVISKLSRWSPAQNALENTASPLGFQGVVDGINHEAMMNYFNQDVFWRDSWQIHVQYICNDPICSKLSTPSKSSGIGVECRTFHPTNCFGKLLPLLTKSYWKQTRWLWL